MTVKEVFKKYSSIEVDLLLSHILGKSKEFIFLRPQKKLSSYQVKKLSSLAKRREKGEPIAYILGYKDFLGLRFKVNKNVLIPRPETEELVQKAIKRLKDLKLKDSKVRILDVGTGSGCIAVSLANQLSANYPVRLYASDISLKALAVAKQNARKYGAKIKFIQSDLFERVEGRFDIIVANLPYVPAKMLRKHLLHRPTPPSSSNPFAGLAYEPVFALTDGGSSWHIYKRFFQQVGAHLNLTPSSDGVTLSNDRVKSLIYLEIDPAQKKELPEIIKKYLPKANVKFYKDFNNFWRYVEISI